MTTIQMRRGTSADWTTKNSVLNPGEVGLETDSFRFKFGNGTTAWNDLPYSLASDLNGKVDNARGGFISTGTVGRDYREIGCALRDTDGTGFKIISDTGHYPLGVSSVVTNTDSIVLSYSFSALAVGSLVVTADETFAAKGYVFGASVGLDTATIWASQPDGLADYIYYDGTVWKSLYGVINFSAFNTTTGALDLTHAATIKAGGSATSRSHTKRATLDSLGETTTRIYFVDNAGAAIKAASTDLRVWVTRAGARRVPMAELVSTTGNLWVHGSMRVT